jgi:DNA topoisomerase-1
MNLKITAGGEIFTATGLRTKKANWFELYEPYVKLKEEEWPNFAENESLKIYRLDLLQKETLPPKRYTPASIITELEKRGLGTKATRAEIVDSLYHRKYVQDESLKVTEMGMRIIETLARYCPDIIDEQLTRHFESEMDELMEKKKKEEEVLDEAKKVLTKILKEFKAKEKKIGEELKTAHHETLQKESYISKCPNCKDGVLRMRFSKKTRMRFIACDKYPDCKTTFAIPQSGGVKGTEKLCQHCKSPLVMVFMKKKKPQEVCLNKECPAKKQDSDRPDVKKENGVQKIEKKCPKCGKDLVLRTSIYGKFIGCTGYPKCRHTEKLNNGESKPAEKPEGEAATATKPIEKKA